MPDRASMIIEDARTALAEMDTSIAELRTERKQIGERIANLVIARKPLARIVSAGRGRRAQGNGESQ